MVWLDPPTAAQDNDFRSSGLFKGTGPKVLRPILERVPNKPREPCVPRHRI